MRPLRRTYLKKVGQEAVSKYGEKGAKSKLKNTGIGSWVSETMAATLKPWNIDVSLIEPGPVKTDMDFVSPYGSHLSEDQDPLRKIELPFNLETARN